MIKMISQEQSFLLLLKVEYKKFSLMEETRQAPPENSPYLVSSTKDLIWIDTTRTKSRLRSAWRVIEDFDVFYAQVVSKIYDHAKKNLWGNINDFSEEGLNKGFDYLRSYEFTDLEVFTSTEASFLKESEKIKITKVSYLPNNFFLITPQDKEFTGILMSNLREQHNLIVHNAARGFAFCVRENS